jgi:hypothetical protein
LNIETPQLVAGALQVWFPPEAMHAKRHPFAPPKIPFITRRRDQAWLMRRFKLISRLLRWVSIRWF